MLMGTKVPRNEVAWSIRYKEQKFPGEKVLRSERLRVLTKTFAPCSELTRGEKKNRYKNIYNHLYGA